MFQGLFLDGFCGGGGASTGIAQAIGRDVDIALNHSESAIAIHKANHPTTEHHCQDIRAAWPRAVTKGRHVAGAWFSPDCKEHSKAKGGPVKDRNIRALPWEIPVWLEETQPDVCYLENVEEYADWGELDENGHVIKSTKGKVFKKWLRACRSKGYKIAYWILRACDFGAPTSRKRLYVVMRRDGLPIVKPKPTHGRPDSPGVRSGRLLPYRTAAECIDWLKPCPSIFDRKRALVDATNRRIAHGVVRYVIEAAKRGKAFIVPVTHQGSVRVHDLDEPVRTVTGAHRGELALVDTKLAPHITKYHTGSAGSAGDDTMPTVTANGGAERPAGAVPLGRVDATLVPFVSYGQHGGANRPVDEPHHTIAASAKDQNMIAAVHLEKFAENSRGKPVDIPLDTVMSGATRHAAVETTLVEAAFLDRQFGNSTGASVEEPIGTTTAGGGGKSAQASAFLSTFNGSDHKNGGGEAEAPLKTARAGGTHHAVVAASMAQFNNNPDGSVNVGHPVQEPVTTLATRGPHQGVIETTMIEEGALPPEMMKRAEMVASFLQRYYGSGNEQNTDGNAALRSGDGADRGTDGRHGVEAVSERSRNPRADRAKASRIRPEQRVSGSEGLPQGQAIPSAGASPGVDRSAGAYSGQTGHQSSGRGEGEQSSRQPGVGHPKREPSSRLQDGPEEAGDRSDRGKTLAGSEGIEVDKSLLQQDSDSARSLADDSVSGRELLSSSALIKYYGEGGQSQAVDKPIDVITVKARYAVVTVTIDSVTYVIVDIGLRMLTPRELARAQGFPDDYVLDPVCWYVTEKGNRKYGRLPLSYQISAIGNSVCPPVARALVRANQPGANDDWIRREERKAA